MILNTHTRVEHMENNEILNFTYVIGLIGLMDVWLGVGIAVNFFEIF